MVMRAAVTYDVSDTDGVYTGAADVLAALKTGVAAGAAGVAGVLYLCSVKDSNLDEATWFLLVVQDAVGGEAPVAVVVKLDTSCQAVGVLWWHQHPVEPSSAQKNQSSFIFTFGGDIIMLMRKQIRYVSRGG